MGTLPSTSGAVAFVRTVLRVTRDEKVSFMAGSLAYYAFVSIFPLGAVFVFALAVVGVEPVTDRVLALTGATLSPAVDGFVRRNVLTNDVSGAIGALVISFATAMWGASRLFHGLDVAFSEIYGTRPERSPVETLLDILILLVTIPLALVGVSVATIVLSFASVSGVQFATPLFLAVGLSVVFLPLYYVFPDVTVSVREVVPGVVVAAVGWVILQQLFHMYVLVMGVSAGSVVGAVVLFLTWLYFAGVVILLGCAVNAVHGGYHGRETTRHRATRRGRRTTQPNQSVRGVADDGEDPNARGRDPGVVEG